MTENTRRSLGLGVGFVTAFLVLGIVFMLDRSSHSGPDDGSLSGGRTPYGTQLPCAGDGKQVSLADAQAEEAFHILFPTDVLANEDNLQAVWVCPADVVQLQFSSGVKITLQNNLAKDPAEAWKNLAEQDPTTTSIGIVRGQPASLIDPEKDPTHSIDGGVTVVDGGLQINVSGNGKLALDDLLQVTESLK